MIKNFLKISGVLLPNTPCDLQIDKNFRWQDFYYLGKERKWKSIENTLTNNNKYNDKSINSTKTLNFMNMEFYVNYPYYQTQQIIIIFQTQQIIFQNLKFYKLKFWKIILIIWISLHN